MPIRVVVFPAINKYIIYKLFAQRNATFGLRHLKDEGATLKEKLKKNPSSASSLQTESDQIISNYIIVTIFVTCARGTFDQDEAISLLERRVNCALLRLVELPLEQSCDNNVYFSWPHKINTIYTIK